jgi:arabinogalactan oligomer/maltooligosaccharide transport system substrate-binding protein
MKLKKIISVLLVAAMAFSMAACKGESATTKSDDPTPTKSAGSDQTPGEKQDVSLVVWGAEEDQTMLQGMIDSFKEKYADQANFDIKLGVQSESTAKDTILTDVEAAADVYAFADDQLAELVDAGALLEVIADDGILDAVTSENSEGSVAAATYNDKIYAYPMTADNGYFLFYDKSYFKDSDVATLEGIVKVCEDNGKIFTMQLNSGWYLYSFYQGAGLSLSLSDDSVTNSCNWNATDTKYTGKDVTQAILNVTASKGFKLLTDEEFASGVKDGTVIAGVNGTWNAATAAEAWGDNYGAAKLPTFSVNGDNVQMSSFAGYKLIGVNGTTDQPYWGSVLAAYLTNYDNQVLRFETRGLGPSNTEAAASDTVKANPAIAALAAQSEYATVQRVGGNFWSPTETFGAILAAGNQDGTDLQVLLDTLVEGINAPVSE